MSFQFRLERLATAAFDRVRAAFQQPEDPGAFAPQHPTTRVIEPACLPAEEPTALHKVRLAREYAEGIALLVEVSAQHQTPLPHAAVRNLRYLSRLLDQAEQDLSPAITERHRIPRAVHEPAVHAVPVRQAEST
jgi:hypothetical protein